MKIVIDNSGQTCNKFWSYLAPISLIYHTKRKVYILFPDANLDYYPYLRKNKYLKVIHSRLLSKVFSYKSQERFLRRLLKPRFFNIIPFLINKFSKYIWYSWNDRDIKLSPEEKEYALSILSPSIIVRETVEDLFSKERNKDTIIIGVHIRRGDYEKWLDGCFFYSLEQYRAICYLLKSEFPNRIVKFFLSSNESIDSKLFPPDEFFFIPNSSASKDLYGLSLCDFIIGPPSTFSRWAAYSGNKPIRFIHSNGVLTKSFRKLESLERYDTGEIVSYEKNGKLYLI